jgi:hypothetical protein
VRRSELRSALEELGRRPVPGGSVEFIDALEQRLLQSPASAPELDVARETPGIVITDIRRGLEELGRRPVPKPSPSFVADLERRLLDTPTITLPEKVTVLTPRTARPGRLVPALSAAAAVVAALVLAGSLSGWFGSSSPAQHDLALTAAVDTVVQLPNGREISGRDGLALPDGSIVRTGSNGRAVAGGDTLGPGVEAVVEDGHFKLTQSTAAPSDPAASTGTPAASAPSNPAPTGASPTGGTGTNNTPTLPPVPVVTPPAVPPATNPVPKTPPVTVPTLDEVLKKLGLSTSPVSLPITRTMAVCSSFPRRALAVVALGALAVAGCGPQGTAPPPAPGIVNIMGANTLTAAQITSWFKKHSQPSNPYNATVPVDQMVQLFIEEGNAEGVRGEVAFLQSIVETGWFRFGGSVPASFNNFSGLGATGGSAQPTAKFPNARTGVRAQIQHLRRYADPSATACTVPPLHRSCVDPRFNLVLPAGKARTWNVMGKGNWAADPNYASKILGLYTELRASVGKAAGTKSATSALTTATTATTPGTTAPATTVRPRTSTATATTTPTTAPPQPLVTVPSAVSKLLPPVPKNPVVGSG